MPPPQAINFISDSHTSRYNFETFKGRANERPRVFPDHGEGREGGLAQALEKERENEKTRGVTDVT